MFLAPSAGPAEAEGKQLRFTTAGVTSPELRGELAGSAFVVPIVASVLLPSSKLMSFISIFHEKETG